MTIDPKAAELAKALADAVAAQQTEEYQALAEAAKQKDEIDAMAEKAAFELREHYAPKVGQGSGSYLGSPRPVPEPGFCTPGIDASIFDPPSSDPAHYELPEDETQTAKPNGGLSDYD
jgi:hypothetical protein